MIRPTSQPRRDSRDALIFAAAEDLAALEPLAARLGLQVEPVEVPPAAGKAAPPARDGALPVLGFAVASAAGQRLAEQVTALWNGDPALGTLPVLDLRDRKEEARAELLLTARAAALSQMLADAARRNADLARALGRMRQQHDEMQAAFLRLESYVYEKGGNLRNVSAAMPPQPDEICILKQGSRLEQRLPGDSSGLSDVAIHIDDAPMDSAGELEVSLLLLEAGETAGSWRVPGRLLRPGWVRLGLDTSLGTERQTAALRLVWHGESFLRLSLSMRHPDPRWCVAYDGGPQPRVLALRAWKSVPGLAAPAAPEAVANAGGRIRRLVIGAAEIGLAEGVLIPGSLVRAAPEYGGLLVRPEAGATAAARLAGAVGAGVAEVVASIELRAADGPSADFALALAPAEAETHPGPRGLPAAERMILGDWVTLATNAWSLLHLILPAPTAAPMDLYLMTRAGSDCSGAEAVFYFVSLRIGDGPLA